MEYLNRNALADFVAAALKEDVGEGDHTTLATIPDDAHGTAKVIFKEDAVLAGAELCEFIMKKVDPDSEVTFSARDGDRIKKGEQPLSIKGRIRAILTAERLILNCLQRMSGIATYTSYLSELISHTDAKLLDTRKTTPNFRLCEKWAVKIGGGDNHRYGLFDMILIKDNHIDFAGGITKSLNEVSEYLKRYNKNLKVEIEARNLEEVKEVLATGKADRILLDNFETDKLREAVQLIDKQTETEASGGISDENIKAVAESGVDYISAGAVTHSAKNIDISLKAVY